MNRDCVQLVEALKAVDWFTHVGEPIPLSVCRRRVASWTAAYEACQRYLYEGSSRMEGTNAIGLSLRKAGFMDRYNHDWNRYVTAIRSVVDPLVQGKVASVQCIYNFGDELFGAISCDITGACLEYEYSDCIPTGHFVSIMPWYLNGHFPCGWDGYFPEGKLIVF